MKKILIIIGLITLSLFLVACARQGDESAFAGQATGKKFTDVSSKETITAKNAKSMKTIPTVTPPFKETVTTKNMETSNNLPPIELVRNGEFDKSLTQGASWEVAQGDLDYMDAEVLKGYTGYSTSYYPETKTNDKKSGYSIVEPAGGLANGFVSRVDAGSGAVDIIGKAVMLQRIPVTNKQYTVSWEGGGASEGTFVGIIEKDEKGSSLTLQSTEFVGCSGKVEDISLYEQTEKIYKCPIDTTDGKTVPQKFQFTPQSSARMIWLVIGSTKVADGQYGDILNKISVVGLSPALPLPPTKIKAYVKRGEIDQLEGSDSVDIIYYPVYQLFVDAQSEVPIQRIAVYNTNGRRTFYYDCMSTSCSVKKVWPSFFLGDKTPSAKNALKVLNDGGQEDYKTYTLESFGEVCLAKTCTSDQIKVELLFMNGVRETVTLHQSNNFYFEGDAQSDFSKGTQPTDLTKVVDHEEGWNGKFSEGCSCPSFKAAPVQEVKQAVTPSSTATQECPTVSCPSCQVYKPLITVTGSNKAECACVK